MNIVELVRNLLIVWLSVHPSALESRVHGVLRFEYDISVSH